MYGRNGDSMQAHVAPGEVVIPREVMTPELASVIAQAIAKAGADPGRYVVGSQSGSYNPATGQQEFFFDKLFSPKTLATALGGVLGGFIPGAENIGAGLGAAVGNKLAGGSWGEAATSGLGTWAGSKYLGPELGDAVGTKIAPYVGGAVGGLLGGAFGDGSEEQDTQLNVPAYNAVGSGGYAGNINTSVPLPNANTNTVGEAPLTTGANIRNDSGVSYLTQVKNRNTGQDEWVQYDNASPFSSNLQKRRSGWGNVITV